MKILTFIIDVPRQIIALAFNTVGLILSLSSAALFLIGSFIDPVK